MTARRVLALIVVAGFAAWAISAAVSNSSDPTPEKARPSAGGADEPDEQLPKKAYLRAACNLPPEWVRLIHRGWAPGSTRDADLILVPRPNNYMGSFINTSHSGPYDFLQNVPLIFYGRGFVPATGEVSLDGETSFADVAPTYARLMGFDFPTRAGTPIDGIFTDHESPPRLIVTAVIDGGGWNVLEYWADAWPNIARLIDEGASVADVIVGSSPSITPATHTNLSTGTFPRVHGVTAIAVRNKTGDIVGAFSPGSNYTGARLMDATFSLRTTTLGDLWDKAQGNTPLVGMVANGNYPLGMLGHGAALTGGDKDTAAIISGFGWDTNPKLYSVPEYLNALPGPEGDLRKVDLMDGRADDQWQGHDIAPFPGTPALAPWQNRATKELIARAGFGADEVTDLLYINYKAPDHAGHEWNMIAPEQEDVIASVDNAIGDLAAFLDTTVGENAYLLVITADHGQTPLEEGGWPINRNEIVADIDSRFDKTINHASIIQRTSATSFFSNTAEMRANRVRAEQVATFLSRYTIGANIPEGTDVPEGFEERVDEPIFSAVFPGRRLPLVARCTGALQAKSP
jgi:hypothetical protein